MISASTAFMQKVNNGDVPFVRMQLTTASGRTIWIEDGQFWGDSISFSEATSEDGAFTVGSAIIGGFNFALTNFDRSFDDIDFAGAVVVPLIYYDGLESSERYLPKGVYYVASHVTSGNIIRCTAMDGMKLLDQSQTAITYPITVQDLVETICTANNITLATQTIPNGDFTINDPTREGDEPTAMTDRQMLSYACQCVGCFAKMDENGHMIIGWYDFENPVQITSTFDGKSLWTNPIEVTGIRVTVGSGGVLMAVSIDANGDLIYMRSSEVSDTFTINSNGELIATAENGVVYTIVNEELIRTGEEITSDSENSESVEILYGTDDRVIKVEENPYITTSNVARVCQIISEQIFGIPFRPGTLPVLANPCLQAGDVLEVTDNITGLVYLIPITSTDYNKGLVQNINCSFEDKEDSDLRPSASYNVRASVDNALRQAQQADAIAQMAQEMAEQSGYQPVVVSNRGGAFLNDGTATLTAVIYDRDANEVDPQGTDMNYRWWITQDGQTGTYLDGGKNITVAVNDSLCDYAAGIYFETRSAEDGIYPFCLSNRNGLVLQTRSGKMLTVRAAERAVTS